MQQTLIRDIPPAIKQREWQKYRGWKIRILEELEHSGGMTTRQISTRIDQACHPVACRLQEMLAAGLVEKVERWGWRITRDGIFVLITTTTTTISQQDNNNITTRSQQAKSEPAPSCFHLSTCHIRKVCEKKEWSEKTSIVCEGCVWNQPRQWIVPRAAVETKVGGV